MWCSRSHLDFCHVSDRRFDLFWWATILKGGCQKALKATLNQSARISRSASIKEYSRYKRTLFWHVKSNKIWNFQKIWIKFAKPNSDTLTCCLSKSASSQSNPLAVPNDKLPNWLLPTSSAQMKRLQSKALSATVFYVWNSFFFYFLKLNWFSNWEFCDLKKASQRSDFKIFLRTSF